MKIRYIGGREWVSTVGLNRKEYFFGKENDYTIEVKTEEEATKLLKSPLHRFMILPEVKSEVKPEVIIPPVQEKIKEKSIEPKKRGRKKNG